MAEGGPQNNPNNAPLENYDGLRSSPNKNDPEFYPPGYVPAERPSWRHPTTGELCRYEAWQKIPQTWDKIDLNKCPINHPICRSLYSGFNPCSDRRREVWQALTEEPVLMEFPDEPNRMQVVRPAPQRPQDALNQSRPQDVAVRHLCREIMKHHRRETRDMYCDFSQLYDSSHENQIMAGEMEWDTSRWHKMNFDKCWVTDEPEMLSCNDNPDLREECKARTTNIYGKILADPATCIKRHPYISKYKGPQAQACEVTRNEMIDWHNPYGPGETPVFVYEPIFDYQPPGN